MPDVAAIDALLPQTQCTRCGYPACRPYAEAIAGGEADINQCPPGGTETIIALSSLYPVVTILLSILVMHDKLTARQGLGIVLAITAGWLLA